MILAAGLGTRLRPLTDEVPKPLLSVAGRPLLGNVILNLRAAGVTEIAVNTHHLPEQIEKFVADLPDAGGVRLFHEPEILGTGGALVNAKEFLSGGQFFLLHNGDALTDLDLTRLTSAHEGSGALATMVLTGGHENVVRVSAEDIVLDILGKTGAAETPGSRSLTYTGIAALSPRIFDYLPPEGPASLTAALIAALAAEPGCIRALAPEKLYWNDVGTPERYLAAHADLLLNDTLSLPDADSGFTPLVEQGSDRLFYRVKTGSLSHVVMLAPPEDPDWARYLEIGRFLHARELGVPEIVAADESSGAALLEDLGDETLYLLARAQRDPAVLEALYTEALDLLVDLQVRATAAIDECPAAASRALDYEQLRWETNYFRENFLGKLLGFGDEETATLDDDFDRLARATEAQPYVFMHRDFQSQNILVKDSRARIVDFQGARRGPLLYDPASLLKDAYVDLAPGLRATLAERYRMRLAERGGPELSADQLREHLTVAGLQRSMQALGAFAFLSLVKGKAGFREFVAPGLSRLEEGLAELEELNVPPAPLSCLAEIVARARERLPGKPE